MDHQSAVPVAGASRRSLANRSLLARAIALTAIGLGIALIAAPAGHAATYTNVVFSDGFESGSFGAWDGPAGTGSVSVAGAGAHSGSYGAQIVDGSGQYGLVIKTLPAPLVDSSTTFWARVGSGGGVQTLAQARDSSSSQTVWTVVYDPARQGLYLDVFAGSGSATEVFTGAGTAPVGTWFEVEVQFAAEGSGGAQLYVDGQTSSGWGVSGDYTRSDNFQKLQLWDDSSSTTYFDDVSVATTPPSAPGAPTGVVGSALDGAAALSWTAPGSNGGSPVTGYRVTPFVNGTAQASILTGSASTSFTVPGLADGTGYTFTVAAINAVGTGPDSSPSAVVTPAPAGVPGAPGGVQGTAYDGGVQLRWSPPSNNGGATITGYEVTPYVNGTAQAAVFTSSADPEQYVSGLTDGTAYTFVVAAINKAGTGPISGASPAITPAAVPTKYTQTAFADGFESGNLNSWDGPAGTGVVTVSAAAAHSGAHGAQIANSSGQYGVIIKTLPSALVDSSTSFWARMTSSGATQTLAQARDSSSSQTLWTVIYSPSLQGLYLDAFSGSGSATEIFTGAGTAPSNTWVKVEVQYTAESPGGATLYVNGKTNPGWTVAGAFARSGNYQKLQLWDDASSTTSFDDVNVATQPPGDATVASAPTAVAGTARDSSVALSWNEPGNDGANPITNYQIVPYIGSAAQTPINTPSGSTSYTVTGLTNGTGYTFTVAAINALGPSPASAASAVVTPAPASAAGAPTAVSATGRDRAAGLSWSAPASDGGGNITGYRVTPYVGGSAQTPVLTGSAATSYTVAGLTNGTAYTFTVAAINSAGTGPDSGPSSSVTPAPAVAPGAPTAVHGSPEDGAVALNWTAPASDGGSPITGYQVIPYVSGSAQTPSVFNSSDTSQTVTGLTDGTAYTFTVAAINIAGTGPQSTASAAIIPTQPNPTQLENDQAGDPNWDNITQPPDPTYISGYGSQISINHGQSIDFYVTTTAPSVTIDVFRMGWYNGAGARLMSAMGAFTGVNQTQAQPDRVTGMVAENWSRTATLNVPSTWTSGVYLARLTASNGYGAFIMFVVRDDGGHEPVLFQTSTNTYQAYNAYGGTSLYNNYTNGSAFAFPHAVKVSFDRPFLNGNGAGQFLMWEYPFIRFLEKNGYSVGYDSDTDTDSNPAPITNHKMLLVVGHDEYWSHNMRHNVQNAIAAGVNVAFFAGNESYWQVRYEPNGAGGADRIMDGYKDFAECSCDGGPDTEFNVDNSLLTSTFRDPLVNQPEDAMMGVMFGGETNNSPYVVTNAANWVFSGTGWTNGTSIPGIVGYEYDHKFADATTPANTTVLSSTPLTNTENNQPDTANSTIYTAPSGAMVFAAGTIQWSWGLDNWDGAGFVNAGIQEVTTNILGAFTGTWTPPGGF